MKKYFIKLLLVVFILVGTFGFVSNVDAKSKASIKAPKIKSPVIKSVPKVKVRGYIKKNGTYVAPHYRTAPDKKKSNNWSTKGNVNPFTGKKGTKK